MLDILWIKYMLICILLQVELAHSLPFGWNRALWQKNKKDWGNGGPEDPPKTWTNPSEGFHGTQFLNTITTAQVTSSARVAAANVPAKSDSVSQPSTTPSNNDPPTSQTSPSVLVTFTATTSNPGASLSSTTTQASNDPTTQNAAATPQAAPAPDPPANSPLPTTTTSVDPPGTTTTMPSTTIILAAAVVSTALTSTASASGGVFAEFSSLSTASVSATPPSSAVTTGTVNTALPSSGQLTVVPFPNGTITSASSTLSPTSISKASSVISSIPASGNIFVPIATGAPPAQIPSRNGHPQQGVGIVGGHSRPIETNKFYTNMMIGDQTFNVFTYPYSLHWLKGTGGVQSWGLGISHVERSQTVFSSGNPPEYYINPLGLDSIILSATELEKGANLTTDSQEAFSVNVNLAPPGSSSNLMTFPLVQGMGFITATYTSATLLIKSGLFFKQLSPVTTVGPSYRWIALLNDGHEWAIYVTPSGNTKPTLTLSSDGSTLQGPGGFSGLVQIAKIENQGEELIYDLQAGVYATSCSLSADNIGAYSLSWQKSGNMSKSLLMFALPHHMETFSQNTLTQVLNITLQTPTKGNATAVLADQWFLAEQLPTSMGFAPWTPTITNATLSDAAKQVIGPVLTSELGQDMIAQTDLTSIYFSGKAFAKFASLVYTAHDLVGNTGLAGAALLRLEDAFGKFVSNTANSTLTYDNDWKGIINSAGYTDPNADFGNPSYNDHMFHYGYFVYTAAVIAYLDPAWLAKDSNKDWVDSLIRDYANPVDNDPYFPFSRNFDWYHGHSWAGGLYDSGDGKDLESSSEDTFASYAIKMWGTTIGDANMEARGNLMLAVQARALSNYFLMQSTNQNQPPNFITNKVSGILFENKVDHTTYFGTDIQYIEGIHMLPVGSHSGLTRPAEFVKEEWATYFDNGRVDAIPDGWKGIVYANYALVDAKTAWNFFSQPNYNPAWLDGGASQSWYLAMSAMLGGA